MFAQSEPLYLIGLLAGAGSVIAFLFRLLIISKDKELAATEAKFKLLMDEKEAEKKELGEIKESYKQIAAEAIQAARAQVNHYREQEGTPPIIPLAKVVPESSSPPNAKQREAALIQTMRSDMAQIKLEAGQEPRREGQATGDPPEMNRPPSLRTDIASIPEKTADKVVEKLEEKEDKEAEERQGA